MIDIICVLSFPFIHLILFPSSYYMSRSYSLQPIYFIFLPLLPLKLDPSKFARVLAPTSLDICIHCCGTEILGMHGSRSKLKSLRIGVLTSNSLIWSSRFFSWICVTIHNVPLGKRIVWASSWLQSGAFLSFFLFVTFISILTCIALNINAHFFSIF